MNNKLGDLLKNIEKDERIDTKNNYQIKRVYERDPNIAIKQVLKQNKGYYYKIISNYSFVSDSFILGAILDSINKALSQLNPKDVSTTYVIYSGTILKHLVSEERKKGFAQKRGGKEKDTSFEKIQSEGYNFEEESLIRWEDNINEFKRIELKDYIERSNELLDIQKKIAKIYIEANGKVNQDDVSEKLGITQQAVSYHLSKIREIIST